MTTEERERERASVRPVTAVALCLGLVDVLEWGTNWKAK